MKTLNTNKIEEEIKSYKDLISFESNGTEISTKILFRRVQLLNEKMNILNGKLKISLNRANARKNLTNEIKEKLIKAKPETLGQASRIAGVTPAAISLLLVYITKHKFNLKEAV